MAYIDSRNKTILTAIPETPPYFLDLSRARGRLIIGDVSLTATKSPIAPTFHRALAIPFIDNNSQDFVLGALSVILIALFSEIILTLLLRTQRRHINRSALHIAYLIDEFVHFRIVWSSIGEYVHQDKSLYRVLVKRNAMLSFIAIGIASIILAVDFVAIHETQPKTIISTASQFNLRGMQPIGTKIPLGRKIRQRTEDMPCLSPVIRRRTQQRNFKIFTCTFHDSKKALARKSDLSDEISISSWYHRGGNDHLITFGKGWRSISVRAEVLIDGSRQRLLFNSSGDAMNNTKYLHDVAMYSTMEWACNRDFSRAGCAQLVSELEIGPKVQKEREVLLWTTAGKDIKVNVTGLVSKYMIRLNAPYGAVGHAISILAASSAVLEVFGPGWYEDSQTGIQQDRFPGLISESARNAGVYLLLVVVVGCITLLSLLRYALNPISLASLSLLFADRPAKKMQHTAYGQRGSSNYQCNYSRSYEDTDTSVGTDWRTAKYDFGEGKSLNGSDIWTQPPAAIPGRSQLDSFNGDYDRAEMSYRRF